MSSKNRNRSIEEEPGSGGDASPRVRRRSKLLNAPEQDYVWDEGQSSPPAEILQLWSDVGGKLDKTKKVCWVAALAALAHADNFLRSSEHARHFIEKYMTPIIAISVEQKSFNLSSGERFYLEESLAIAVTIVAKDLEIQIERSGKSIALEALKYIFDKEKPYCSEGNDEGSSHTRGLPEVRRRILLRFQDEGGFLLLNRYLRQNLNSPSFPEPETLHHMLVAVRDVVGHRRMFHRLVGAAASTYGGAKTLKQVEDEALSLVVTVMRYIANASEDTLEKLHWQTLVGSLITAQRSDTNEFYKIWRALILKLITSQSLPLKLLGWEQMGDMIDVCRQHRPPPRSFVVKDAGCPFVNGTYLYAGPMTEEGYHRPDGDISYVRKIPEHEEGGGKTLTLFRCTMRSQKKWWFISEADEEQPGTDRDIDYYQHNSKEREETCPPPTGWSTCRSAGKNPPPTLEPKGFVVPEGQEFETLETLDHQLAKWAIENEIVEHIVGDTATHPEIIARATVLMKFLAEMCNPYHPWNMMDQTEQWKCYLQSSYLLFTWETCLRKAREAISSHIYQLLVAALPLCSVDTVLGLLEVPQAWLCETDATVVDLLKSSKVICWVESSEEIRTAFAEKMSLDNMDEVSAKKVACNKILQLLWSILSRLHASSTSYKEPRIQGEDRLSRLPDGLLRKWIFPFMRPDDISALGVTNHSFYTATHILRSGPLPYILREERLPTKMAFETYWRNFDDAAIPVHQIHPFRFLLRTESHGIVEVRMKLGNCVWSETRTGGRTGIVAGGGGPTWIGVEIVQKIRMGNGDVVLLKIFQRDQRFRYMVECNEHRGNRVLTCPWCQKYHVHGGTKDPDPGADSVVYPSGVLSKAAQWALRDSMLCILTCAERIANFPDKGPSKYPSVEYIMAQLPLRLRPLFPKCLESIDWSHVEDRQVVKEWKYRRPPSAEDWGNNIIRPNVDWLEFDIGQLSWYRDWYPDPVSLDPSNLIDSLPESLLEESIFPFLLPREQDACSQL